ncbi:hypothetical protein Tco_1548886 [Tanacetum coccineum]
MGGLEGDEERLHDELFELESNFEVLFFSCDARARKERTRDHVANFFELTGDEDLTDEDGDTGMGDLTGVSMSLGGEISSEGKESRESNIGDSDNTRDGGKTAGRVIITWGGRMASYVCIYGLSGKGGKNSMSKRYLVKSFEELGEMFPGEAGKALQDDDTAKTEGLNSREKDVALNAGGDELNSPTNTFLIRLLCLIEDEDFVKRLRSTYTLVLSGKSCDPPDNPNDQAKFDRLADKQSGRPSGSLPSNTQPNPKGRSSKPYQPPQARNEHVNAIFKRSDDEPTPQPKPKTPKPVKETLIPKPYKPKIPYPQRLRKEKMEAQYGKFLDMIRAFRINVPLVDVLAGMPNYYKFLKELNISTLFLMKEAKILHSIEGTILEEEIFSEFDKFIAMVSKENYNFESDTEEPPFEKITINTDYKIKTSLKEPPTDLELKPLLDNLEYVFLEEPSFLAVIISSQLSAQKNKTCICP